MGLAVSYAWDFDGDGQFDDAVGATPVFSAAGILGSQTLVIALRVTDTSGSIGVDSAVIRVPPPLYVDDTAVGLKDGTSWANAYTSLQAALVAAIAPQGIRVAQGTYKPTATSNRTASFVLKNGVSILGGYAGFGAADPDARDIGLYITVLSGDIGTVGSTADNSYHVVVGSGTDATAVLDGVTITAGNANEDFSNVYGGGMYNGSGSPTLTNCTFTANSSKYHGGGMHNSSSSPTLTNCTFAANSASINGGGMYNSSSSPTLTNCTLTANSGNVGGGMYNDSASSPALNNCAFTANSANYGGGICNYSSSSPTLTNCTIIANAAAASYGRGGGICNDSSSPMLTNCLLWANTAFSGSEIYTYSGTPVATYCDIQGGYSGTGNIDLDPQFVRNPSPGPDGTWGTADDDYGDLRLRLTSPCIDAGQNSALPVGITSDLAGNPRFADVPAIADTGSGITSLVDIGACEAPAAVQALAGGPYRVIQEGGTVLVGAGYSPTGLAVSYAWDFDGDGQFDDASGPTPLFSAAGMQGPQTLVIALRVTDASGAMGVQSATLHVVRPLYVDDSAVGLNNGTSWANACTSLQAALAAAVIGDAICVAQGTYKPTAATDRTASFTLKNGVSILGGYAGFGAAEPDARDIGLYPTFLSGDIGTVGVVSDNSYHVVMASGTNSTAVLEGVTITAGNANRSSPNNSGGGMYNVSASPTLISCTFIANSASDDGGGMYNSSLSSSPTLINCTFTANSAGDDGGGIFNFASSTASLTLSNCTFIANSGTGAKSQGGGIYDESPSSSPTLTNCILWANTASTSSQIYIRAGTPAVTYCDIQGGYSGTGNIDLDPQFVRNPSPGSDGTWGTDDDDYGDLRLRLTSPCIDAGQNSAVPPSITSDLAGNPRFADVPAIADTGSGAAPLVDMGAYESPAVAVGGTGGHDDFSLSLTTDQASVQISLTAESHTYAVSAITSLVISGGLGDDRLTVDFINGSPVPENGVAFHGQDGTDTLHIAAPGSNATLTGTQVIVGTAAPIVFHGTEGISFDLGNGRLTKSGSGAAVLARGSSYSGGTEVVEGTLVVGHAEGLPAGGALTIGAGGTVVLAAGLSVAAGQAAATSTMVTAAADSMAAELIAPLASANKSSTPLTSIGNRTPVDTTSRPIGPAPANLQIKVREAVLPTCSVQRPEAGMTWLSWAHQARNAPKKHAAFNAAVDEAILKYCR